MPILLRGCLLGLGLGCALPSIALADAVPAPSKDAAPKPAAASRPADRWHGADKPYLAAVHARIHQRWSDFLRELVRAPAPFQNPLLAVEVALTVTPDGKLEAVRVTRLSGLAGFDEAPRDLLADVGLLPPPPPEVRSDDDRAHLHWRFARLEPGCESFEMLDERLPLDQALARLIEARREGDAMERLDQARREDAGTARAALPQLATSLALPAAAAPEAATRAAAAEVLARVPAGEAALMKLAGDPDASVRRAALEALGTPPRTTAAIAVLLGALGGSDLDARVVAARSLGRARDKAAVPPLLDALGKAVAPFEAARALAQLGESARAAELIVAQLAGKGPARLSGALAAAGLADPALGGKLASALGGATEQARMAIVDAVRATGKETSPEGRKVLTKAVRDTSPSVRARALLALTAIGDKAARARIVEALADPAPPVRAAAATALVELGVAATTDEFARLAADKAPAVRSAVAAALVAHPYEGSDKILARLAADNDPAVKAAATPAAGRARSDLDPADRIGSIVRADSPTARLRALAAALTP